MAILTPVESSQIKKPFSIISTEDIFSGSAEETMSLGESLAANLKRGSIVAISGTLGAGKTCFAKGIAKGLGITEEITSPSYAIICEYEAEIPLYHIDAYRLENSNAFAAIGGDEIIFGDGISIIEWSNNIDDIIGEDAIRVEIKILEDEKRSIKIYNKIYDKIYNKSGVNKGSKLNV